MIYSEMLLKINTCHHIFISEIVCVNADPNTYRQYTISVTFDRFCV